MDLSFAPEDLALQAEAREFLRTHLEGPWSALRGRGGPGDEQSLVEERLAWERFLAAAGWNCLGWPVAWGGRAATLTQEVLFEEEYARARGPGRLGHIGQTLLGPTLLAFGTEAQKERFLPGIRDVTELWCQGYSEPNAGSDLANVQTRAVRERGGWRVTGQKVWTSLAHHADWCFLVVRTSDAPRHKGLSYLLMPMKGQAPGALVIRPIEQITGGAEFCELFLDGAEAPEDGLVGEVDGGWKVAMATLAFERGVSTLAQQIGFESELRTVCEVATRNGAAGDAGIRRRIADAWMGLRVMRLNALRNFSGSQGGTELPREALITKLHWATWHRSLGELAMDVLGAEGEVCAESGALTELQRLFLWTRCDTIYAGSNQIQRTIIGERGLGLPR